MLISVLVPPPPPFLACFTCTFTPPFFCRIILWCLSLLLLVIYYSVSHACFFHVWYFCVPPNKELGLMCILETLCWTVPKNHIRVCTSRFTLRFEGQRSTNAGHQIARMAKFFTASPCLCGASVCKVPFDAVLSGRNLTTFRHRYYHLHGRKSFCLEDWESTSLRNVCRFISFYTASDPRRLDYSCFIFYCFIAVGFGISTVCFHSNQKC